MDFLDNLMTMLPAAQQEEIRARLVDLSAEERAELATTMQRTYQVQRNSKSMRNINTAIRAHQADRRPEGAAATRRRKQMERANAKSTG